MIALLLVQQDIDTPVPAAFLFDFANADLADLRRRPEMRASAGLQIDACDLQ